MEYTKQNNWEAQNIAEKLTGCIGGPAEIVQSMFEVIEDVLAFWDQPPNGPGGNTLRKVWLDKIKANAEAAIAKARG